MQVEMPLQPIPPGAPPNCDQTAFWGGAACKQSFQEYNQKVSDYNYRMAEWQHQAGKLAIEKIETQHQQRIEALIARQRDEVQQATLTGAVYGVGGTLLVFALLLGIRRFLEPKSRRPV